MKLKKNYLNYVVILLNIILIGVVLYFSIILKDYIVIMDLNPCEVCFSKLREGYYYIP